MNSIKLSEKLKKLRIDKGYSQEELSEKSNLSLRTIQRLENGESSPREDTINLLIKAFDLPNDFFIESKITKDETKKIAKRRIPWFIISLTTIGCSVGVLLGINFVLKNKELPNDGVSSIIIITIAILFSGIGILTGSLLEKKYNKY
jgi:transcriptional regulator with XRE-family HTH domain